MTIDPTDAETFDRNEAEEAAARAEEESAAGREEATALEAPEADVAEQRAELQQRADDPLTGVDPSTANEADAVEQTRLVGQDDDDYR
ncbi:hypothetical protein C6N75_17200 [Streptomyces solincola]|uniref:DUF5709 domain-containing protein n=2 Tax=Streptomyces solincola TaxID=2100817 RepID=A0A2S9PUD4_9ACTN|nr:hypothetical protein [Streptomyces solincola]PRH78024.1 hypothetical protein C6N75_17200 [Streptomyces solincola]